MDRTISDIEEAFVTHWSYLGRWSRGALREEGGALWFETPVAHLPYNGVIRSRLGGDPDRTIGEITKGFCQRGVDFMWIVHPTATPDDLDRRLADHGLESIECVTGMTLDLADWSPGPAPADIRFEKVVDEAGIQAYADLNQRYFELPEEARAVVNEMIHFWLGRAPVERWLAVLDGRYVGKGLLSYAAPPGVAAIYGMSVLPEARRRGIGGGLTTAMVMKAREQGCSRVVLHATEVGQPVYRRVGFVEKCQFTVFATAPIWSVHDH